MVDPDKEAAKSQAIKDARAKILDLQKLKDGQ